jgi:hypothetical protein
MKTTPEQFVFYKSMKESALTTAGSFPGGYPLKPLIEAAWNNNEWQAVLDLYDKVNMEAAKYKAANTRTSRERPYHEPTAIERLTAYRQR